MAPICDVRRHRAWRLLGRLQGYMQTGAARGVVHTQGYYRRLRRGTCCDIEPAWSRVTEVELSTHLRINRITYILWTSAPIANAVGKHEFATPMLVGRLGCKLMHATVKRMVGRVSALMQPTIDTGSRKIIQSVPQDVKFV